VDGGVGGGGSGSGTMLKSSLVKNPWESVYRISNIEVVRTTVKPITAQMRNIRSDSCFVIKVLLRWYPSRYRLQVKGNCGVVVGDGRCSA
jgi:hypothetical protein